MNSMDGNLLQEIRINPEYTHLGFAEYKKNLANQSSEIVIKNNSLLTNDFTHKLSRTLNNDVTIFPPNCRYLEQTDKGTLVVVEEPPALRTIRVSMRMSHLVSALGNQKIEEYGLEEFKKVSDSVYNHKFTLAFPYVIFIFFFNMYNEFNRAKVFLRIQQMSGFSDLLLRNPMLNINSDQNVCMGDKVYLKNQSLYSAVQNAIDVWWGATFNFDYRENYNRYKNTPILNNYLEWQYFSQHDPMFIFRADWLPYNLNLFQVLTGVKDNLRANPKTGVTYRDMVKVFTKAIETGTQEKPTANARTTQKLFYDIAQSVYLNNDLVLAVGDPVVLKNGERAYVYSFIGFSQGGVVKYVQLEKNGTIMTMRYDEPFKKFMIKQIHKYRFTQKLKLANKEVLKPGDIIIIKSNGQEQYKKIDYIRQGRVIDNVETYEVKCGNNYYLSHKLDAKVFNMNVPKVGDIELNKKDSYIFIKEPDSMNGLVPASQVKFNEVNITGDGSLYAQFNNTGYGLTGERHHVYFSRTKRMPYLVQMKEVRQLKGVFRIGRNCYYTKSGSKETDASWAYNGSVLYENYHTLSKPTNAMIKNLVNKDTFFIPGADFDTTFRIGDKVVVANWAKPIEVLNVKTITGFKHDAEYGNLSFVLQSKDNKLSEVQYIDGQDGTIRTGHIRRVTNQFDKLTVGTKIIAKNTGIANFPKKDVNIVVAIIDDGPYEPLVLCSNGCTLWYSTVMRDFQKVTMKAKKWKTLTHVPLDMSKIKFQAGDIINGRRSYSRRAGFILFDPSSTRYLKALPIDYYPGYPDHQIFDKYFSSDAIFDTIPTPRISAAHQAKMKSITAFVDFHGGIIPDPFNRTKLTFLDERGG